jgi:hypothetical protein
MSDTTPAPATMLGEPPADAPAGSAAPAPAGTPPASTPPAGTDARDWLPEAFRANPVFKDIASVEALAKSYDGAARLVGLDKGQVLRLPASEDAPEWADVFTRLGRPESPDKYEFPELPGQLVEGVEPAARDTFHKLGLSAKQARGVMELYGGQVQAAEAARLEKAEQVEAAVVADLRREWGDDFDNRLLAAQTAVRELGGPDLGKLMNEARMPDGTRLGQHPLLVKAFAEMGRRIAEPGDLRGGGGGTGGPASYTPDEAAAEIKRLTSDTEFHAARRDPRHADHVKNVETWSRLNKAAAAGRSWVA